MHLRAGVEVLRQLVGNVTYISVHTCDSVSQNYSGLSYLLR